MIAGSNRMAKRRNSKSATVEAPAKRVVQVGQAGNGGSQLFGRMASRTSHLAGKPLTFLIAVAIVVIWAACGPLFGYSDTWQLVINTSTTIVTFLMVFLIQNTQNRDTLALQVKLAELIIAVQGAQNKIAIVEDLSEEDLQRLHESYRKQAEDTLAHLESRRSKLKKTG